MDHLHSDGLGSKDMEEPAPPGISDSEYKLSEPSKPSTPGKLLTSSKGVENAKKRLRAFSIQKKAPLSSLSAAKPSTSGTSAVFIGRLNSIRPSRFAPVEDEPKKPPKPPKPGSGKMLQESYCEVRKKTLSDIEDMKRKMELVELGIPLGLICPGVVDDKAMPTKAMPPIKSLLDPQKIDEIIREAKKARHEGKEYKFDYRKLLPDYDNPFQRKKEDSTSEEAKFEKPSDSSKSKDRKRDSYSKHDSKKYYDYERDKRRGRSKEKLTSKSRDKDMKPKESQFTSEPDKSIKETNVNLKDYLVCDSWSLDDKTNSSSPKVDDKSINVDASTSKDGQTDVKEASERLKPKIVESPLAAKPKDNSPLVTKVRNSPLIAKGSPLLTKAKQSLMVPTKVRLQPVIDSFKFEIDDPNDDDIVDLYEDVEDIPLPPGDKMTTYEDPVNMKIFDDVEDTPSCDEMDDDVFLESVINEIKGENIDEDYGQEKSLVEYEMSPVKDEDSQTSPNRSVTPELDDSMRELQSSRHSNYSDGYRSTESGYKSTESGYKSTESGYKNTEAYKNTKNDSKCEQDLTRDEKLKDKEYKAQDDRKSKSDKKRDKSKSPEREGKSDRATSSENYRMSMEKEDDVSSVKMSKYTMDSLETWSFVLKFCQPLLFRHDKAKCYKETRTIPKLWYAAAPKHCECVQDRSVVYAELQDCKMALVDRVYGCDLISDPPFPSTRSWYPRTHQCLSEGTTVPIASDWEADDCLLDEGSKDIQKAKNDSTTDEKEVKEVEKSRKEKDRFDVDQLSKKELERVKGSRVRRSTTPLLNDEISLDREYQKFMEAVWPGVGDPKPPAAGSTTPTQELDKSRKKIEEDTGEDKKRAKKMKLSSDGWSQESEVDEEPVSKKQKTEKKPKARKRKHSVSTLSDSEDEDAPKKKKKADKKKEKKKNKSKLAKRKRTEKKRLKKLKDKQKKRKILESSDVEEKEIKKKSKKKKHLKLKKKELKKKKSKKVSSSSDSSDSSSSSTESTSGSESSDDIKKSRKEQRRKKKEKKRKKSTSESTQSEAELFDANILNNIKKELTDEENIAKKKPREIINVKELQNDFVGNNVLVKQEIIKEESSKESTVVETEKQHENEPSQEVELAETSEIITNILDIPLPQKIPVLDENLSQSSSQASQESICSVKDYEKDESHLRPSSQNSNYSFNDVIASGNGLYNKAIETENECEKFGDNYEPENYEVYEQMALAYQNDVANQPSSETSPGGGGERRIETVVRRRGGEIKCDWRAAEHAGAGGAGGAGPGTERRPSRWGLKPGEVNIVLTGGHEAGFKSSSQPVYQIESLANRNTDNSMSYDEAYMDTYGASDRLQYGDCFAEPSDPSDVTADKMAAAVVEHTRSSLDDRIDRALRNSVLGEVARDPDDDKENKDRNKNSKQSKSVSFADGYKPGQDSDVEDPPKKKKKKVRRLGCAWPCPATHPDHVPLWDALPPPPPPPLPNDMPAPPPMPLGLPGLPLLSPRVSLPPMPLNTMMTHPPMKFDPSLPGFMPPEPPPGLISFN